MRTLLKYHFPAGDSRVSLPAQFKKDGFYIPLKNSTGSPVSETRLNELGILVLIPASPEAGKIITKSHGELITGKWVEVIDEQLTAEEIEAQRHSVKPLKLKQAENFYISIIAAIPESLGIVLDTTTEIITSKLETESDKPDGVISELQAVKVGLKLQAAVSEIERQGGSWYDLPTQAHNLEE